jgi:hypothetical protein
MKARLVASSLACAVAVLAARSAAAMPSEVHLVYWKQDTSFQSQLDEMFSCLAESSNFGTTWAAQFGVSPVHFDGSTVLATPAPSTVTLDGNLTQIMTDAFDKGLVPAPNPNAANSYVVMVPQGSVTNDSMGVVLCDGSGQSPCGEHDTTMYNGLAIDIAVVPTQCPDCGGGLYAASVTVEHEAAEGIADLGTSQYEVGDGCESQSNLTMLQCCGHQYTVQQLAGAGGPNDCQTMKATGSACYCAMLAGSCKTAKDCCDGLTCKASGGDDGGGATQVCCKDLGAKCTQGECCGDDVCMGGVCAATPLPPPPEPSGNEDAGGSFGRGGDGGSTGSSGDDGGSNADNGSPGQAGAGCGCKQASSASIPGEPLLVSVGLLLLFALRRRPS